MRFAPFVKALLLAAVGFSVARALLVHDGVGVVEWVVGAAVLVVLGGAVVHFARVSFRTT